MKKQVTTASQLAAFINERQLQNLARSRRETSPKINPLTFVFKTTSIDFDEVPGDHREISRRWNAARLGVGNVYGYQSISRAIAVGEGVDIGIDLVLKGGRDAAEMKSIN